MTVVEHHSVDELQGLFRQAKDAQVAKRTWIVWQARLGRIEPQITAAIRDRRFDVGQFRRTDNPVRQNRAADKIVRSTDSSNEPAILRFLSVTEIHSLPPQE